MVDLLINKACFVKKLIMFAISKAAAKVVGTRRSSVRSVSFSKGSLILGD
jgi:hypothetical protein